MIKHKDWEYILMLMGLVMLEIGEKINSMVKESKFGWMDLSTKEYMKMGKFQY